MKLSGLKWDEVSLILVKWVEVGGQNFLKNFFWNIFWKNYLNFFVKFFWRTFFQNVFFKFFFGKLVIENFLCGEIFSELYMKFVCLENFFVKFFFKFLYDFFFAENLF